MWIKLIVSAVFALPLLYIAIVPMLPFPMPGLKGLHSLMMNYPPVYALIELGLVIPPICVGYIFYTVGYKSLFKGHPNMDSLIAVGTTAAVLFSLYNTVMIGLGDSAAVDSLYYESAAVIITLIMLGKSLEAVSKGKTGAAIKKLMGLAPKTATIIDRGVEKKIRIRRFGLFCADGLPDRADRGDRLADRNAQRYRICPDGVYLRARHCLPLRFGTCDAHGDHGRHG